MAGRRRDVLDVREMVRRWKLGETDRQVARDLGAGRHTVAKYHKVATASGWLSRSDLPTAGEIELRLAAAATKGRVGPPAAVEKHRALVVKLRSKGVEVMALWQILKEDHGFTGSYTGVRRYVRRLEAKLPEAFVRVETDPGQEAQVDFGSVGLLYDPAEQQQRKAWVFVMTLSFSRHQYAEIVFDQKVETWIALHVRAFEWFGGVPGRIVPDNLKAAVVKACFHDPQVQRSYRELAEHYNFTIAPCRPRTPQHNAYAERRVRSVKEECLDRLILFGEASLRHALGEYVAHFHRERSHQGLENCIPFPADDSAGQSDGPIERKERLGGLLKFYRRRARRVG